MAGKKQIQKFIHMILAYLSVAGILLGVIILWKNNLSYVKEKTRKAQSIQPKDFSVLFLSSYNGLDSLVKYEEEGILKVLESQGINCLAEYMDTKNYNATSHRQSIYENIKFKISEKHFDAVILGDDAALSFALNTQEELFKGLPLVFLGINNFDLANRAMQKPLFTGSIERVPLADCLNLIKFFFPKRKKIYVFADQLTSSVGNLDQFQEVKESFSDLDFTLIDMNYKSEAELATLISEISFDSAIMVMGYFINNKGKIYTEAEMGAFFYAHSNAPVFYVGDMRNSKGMLAGAYFDHTADGEYAGNTVIDILLNNKDTSDIPIKTNIKAENLIDYSLMEKYGLKKNRLPKDIQILNKPPSFFKDFNNVFFPALIVFVSCIVLVTTLMFYSLILKKSQATLRFMATHDVLTKLPTRALALEQLHIVVNNNIPFSIILFDIDDFQQINDYYSPEFADEILIELSTRLSRLKADIKLDIFRFGGDEFLLILYGINLNKSEPKMYYLRHALSSPFMYNGTPIFLKASVGVVTSAEAFDSAEKYVVAAGIAKSEAKHGGKNISVFYNSAMGEIIKNRHKVRTEIEKACKENLFKVVFQPQIELTTKEVFGFEALIRLQNEKYPPGEFISVAEESGLMPKVGRILTEKVINTIVEWRNNGVELKKISINYSAAQMKDKEYIPFLKALLAKNAIDPKYICIEITESMLFRDRALAKNIFDEFSSMGLRIALDDFGTGYSSFSYLTYIPATFVKLDKSLVDTYLKQEKYHVVENLINFVHGLNMKVIIEGIEEKWQADKIVEYKGDYIQGYYYSRPLESKDAQNFKLNI